MVLPSLDLNGTNHFGMLAGGCIDTRQRFIDATKPFGNRSKKNSKKSCEETILFDASLRLRQKTIVSQNKSLFLPRYV